MWDFSTLEFAPSRGRSGIDASEPSEEELLERRERSREQKQSLFAAIAVSWTESRVTVLCPFCKKTHKHGINHFHSDPRTGVWIQNARGQYTYDGPSPTRCEARLSHCERDRELRGISVSYTILFPFENDSRVERLSFEIGKDSKSFHTVGLVVSTDRVGELESFYGSETWEERELPLDIQKMSLKDGDYDISYSFQVGEVEDHITQPASIWIQSQAVRGDLQSLKQLLEDSPDPKSLVKMRSEEGESLLCLAVPNGHLEVVKYLLECGCDIDAADAKGRTPLMEAALWGQPQILNVLLKAGANKLRKDQGGMTAENLAEESGRNDWERHKRSCTKYREDPYIKKKHRLLIRALLRGNMEHDYPAEIQLPRQIRSQDAHFYKSQSAETMSLVLPSQGVKIRYQAKTAAVLLRGDAFPPVVAVSGWGGPHATEFLSSEAGLERLNERYWSFETLKVASDIGVKFKEHVCDREEPSGIFYASHAEAQLMSLFVRRNYVFRDYEHGQNDIDDDFLQLFMLQPRNRTAEILVSKRPCDQCESFKDFIFKRLGIKFILRELEELKVKER